MTDHTDLMGQAIAAAKQKDYASARRLLGQILRQDPNNLEAWLLASHVVEKRSDAIGCYKRVLQIDPNHAYAKQRLATLQSELPVAAPVDPLVIHSAVPNPVNPVTANQPVMPASITSQSIGEGFPQAQPPGSTRKSSNSTSNLVILGGAVLIVMCLVIFGAAFALQNADIFGFAAPTPTNDELFSVLYRNARATNDENLEAYMATIHPSSPLYRETRLTVEQLFDMYDLLSLS